MFVLLCFSEKEQAVNRAGIVQEDVQPPGKLKNSRQSLLGHVACVCFAVDWGWFFSLKPDIVYDSSCLVRAIQDFMLTFQYVVLFTGFLGPSFILGK